MAVMYTTTLLILTGAVVCSTYTHTTLELSGVVKCSTGRSALAYIMYGCYCGVGGEGWPRDPADWCCHKHDCCYAKAEDQGCYTKTHTYPWSCDSQPLECGSLTDRCEKMLCVCDREAAKCLKKAPYNLKYVAWPDFLCGPELPTCAYY
ncbi:phospholipase A2-like [Hemibagrus wyckioides]|uniref:phospholipase A2-like n=2 Tax=Hemibagrus wyckioides TaxID=337641 RepID=UPI00266B4A42|nr:phospholipase A2-like [Hemibagrus wyckioides]